VNDWNVAGKLCVVTGANTGIGRETALALGRLGAELVLACRSIDKARPVADEIARASPGARVELVALDLGSFASVREAAARIGAGDRPVHVLVNNAGVVGKPGNATADGFELAFGVNHLGHFLLTMLLGDRLRSAASARVVTVASRAHLRAPGVDWDALRAPTRSATGWPEYCVSKLANVLFSAELARRWQGSSVTTYALHPGVIGSDLWRRVPWPFRPAMQLFMKTNAEGARVAVRCATAPELSPETGLYYDDDGRPRPPGRRGRDPELARALWERSLAWTGLESQR